MNKNAEDAVMAAYVRALIKLLLGNLKMQTGVAITAGDPLDREGYIDMAHRAVLTNTDLLHIEFGSIADGTFGPVQMTAVLPRDEGCQVETGCKLWLSATGNRAVILPRPTSVGHFRFTQREIVHKAGKPSENLAAGVELAKHRFAQLFSQIVASSRQELV